MSHNTTKYMEPKNGVPKNSILDDEYVREFDRMIREQRRFLRSLNEREK